MKDQFIKVIWVFRQIVENEEGITLKELQERWENSPSNDYRSKLSRRSFVNYCHTISEIFGVSLLCDAAHGYRYRLSMPENFHKDRLKSWMLSSFAVNNLLQESKALQSRVVYEDIPSGNRHLVALLRTLRDGRAVELAYRDFGDVVSRRFVLAPAFLRVFRRRWYVVGTQCATPELPCEAGGETLRRYALDRIERLTPTDLRLPSFSRLADPSDYFAGSFGIIVDPEEADIETVRIKAYTLNHKRDYIRSLPLHESQEEVECTPEYSLFEYTLRPSYDFMQELLSHGEEIEVVSPPNFREHFRRRIAAMLARYADDVGGQS